jgi:hypothetical protein
MEVTPAVEEPLEAAHDGPSVEMLDEFIPACAVAERSARTLCELQRWSVRPPVEFAGGRTDGQ